MDKEEAIGLLNSYGQTHIANLFKKLDNAKKQELINQINQIDFQQIMELYENTKKEVEFKENKIEPISYLDKAKLTKEVKEEFDKLGEEIIKSGKYAVVTMAGGQGTRLGHKGPKGTFKIDVNPEPKYLFQILAENLERANKEYQITLPWYIMTSTENNKETIKFFEEHNYFSYPKSSVKFFIQGNLPLLFTDGQLVLDKDYSIKQAADGNGCIYKAMAETGIITEMKEKGIQWIFIGSVDNVLLNMVDPILIGLTINQNNQIASKSIAKKDPSERVGVFCKANGEPSVIEYSELPKEMSELRDENGELLYGEAHIMCNLFSIDAIEKISKQNLPYHVANKKTNYMNENGEFVEVTEPNAYKFEAFIFDAFNYFDNISILRGKRENDFAPVKNKQGNDSPETARKLYNDYWNK